MSEPWHYIVLLGAAIAVIAYAMPRAKSKAAETANTKDMEQLFEQYMYTAEQEHEALVQLVKEAQQSSKQSASANESKVSQLEAQLAALMNELEQQKKSRGQLQQAQAADDNVQAVPVQVQEQAEEKPGRTSLEKRYEQLFQLYESGKSIEAIAKKLQLNKGEVQLIIQLAKQEASARG